MDRHSKEYAHCEPTERYGMGVRGGQVEGNGGQQAMGQDGPVPQKANPLVDVWEIFAQIESRYQSGTRDQEYHTAWLGYRRAIPAAQNLPELGVVGDRPAQLYLPLQRDRAGSCGSYGLFADCAIIREGLNLGSIQAHYLA